MNLFEAHSILNILNVEDNEGQVERREIEKAYRKQALKLHPDRGGDASLFRQLQAAREVALQQFGTSSTAASYRANDDNTAIGETLHKDRTCVRQVVSDPSQDRDRIVVATDDGLWLLTRTSSDAGWDHQSFEVHMNCFCCVIVGDMVYAGAKRGQHGVLSTPYRETNILSIAAISQGWISIATSKRELAILLNLSDAPGPPNMMLAWKTCLESQSPEAVILESTEDAEFLYLWVGASKPTTNKGELLFWKLDTSELYGQLADLDSAWQWMDNDDDEDDEDDDDDDDDDGDSDEAHSVSKDPIIVQPVKEGPLYSIAKHHNTIAAAVGQNVLVWEFGSSNDSCLIPLKTLSIPGDYAETLYTISLSDDFLVAAGSGECLFVWTTDIWDLVHTILVAQPKECALATCCVLTTDWIPKEKGGLSLVCGGYDGCISLWRLAHQLENDG